MSGIDIATKPLLGKNVDVTQSAPDKRNLPIQPATEFSSKSRSKNSSVVTEKDDGNFVTEGAANRGRISSNWKNLTSNGAADNELLNTRLILSQNQRNPSSDATLGFNSQMQRDTFFEKNDKNASLLDTRSAQQFQMYPSVSDSSDHRKTFISAVINDYTEFTTFFHALNMYMFEVIDTVIWSILAVITVSTFCVMGWLGWIFQYPIAYLLEMIGTFMGGRPAYFNDEPIKSAQISEGKPKNVILSYVNLLTPDIHNEDDYGDILEDANRGLTAYLTAAPQKFQSMTTSGISKQCSFEAPAFNYEAARFFLHLSALAYEEPEVFAYFVKKWNLHHFYGNVSEGCVCVVVYSRKDNWITVAMKGTSPFDLGEWLTDASLSKLSPSKHFEGRLPGMVHRGFYAALGYPMDADENLAAGSKYSWPALNIRQSLCTIAQRLKQRNGKVPNLWVTGHSLGAAIAQMFTAHLAFNFDALGIEKTFEKAAPSHDRLSDMMELKGCYSFGTPRVGDRDFAKCMNQLYRSKGIADYRVINANDIVTDVPLAWFGLTKYLRVFHTIGCSICQLPETQFPPAYCNSPLDFESVGRPLFIQYSGHPSAHERNFSLFARGVLGYIKRNLGTIPRLLKGEQTLLSSIMMPLTPFFIADHAPSEYLRNLNNAAKEDYQNMAMIIANIRYEEARQLVM